MLVALIQVMLMLTIFGLLFGGLALAAVLFGWIVDGIWWLIHRNDGR